MKQPKWSSITASETKPVFMEKPHPLTKSSFWGLHGFSGMKKEAGWIADCSVRALPAFATE